LVVVDNANGLEVLKRRLELRQISLLGLTLPRVFGIGLSHSKNMRVSADKIDLFRNVGIGLIKGTVSSHQTNSYGGVCADNWSRV
jgi:hypothetical protein